MLFNPFRTFRQRLTNSYRIPHRRKSRRSLKTPVSSAVELLEQRLLLTCAVDGDGWVSDDGGCLDLRTGLVFSVDQTETVGGATFTWDGAVGHAGRSVEGGFDDWRLPTIDELVAARENGFNDHGDILFLGSGRWSSDTKKYRGIDSAYYFAFSTGEIKLGSKDGVKNLFIVRDSNPVAGPWIYVDDVIVAEADTGETTMAIFTIRVDGDDGRTNEIIVNYATQDGTATTADGDYISESGMLTFAPGVQIQTVEVTIPGDTVYDPAEDFQLVLSITTGGSIVNSPATARIFDNEAAPLTASFSGVEAAVSGEEYVLALHLSDPDSRNDMAEWKISWGDGNTTTVDGTTQSVSHVFDTSSTLEFDITATFDIDKFDTLVPIAVQRSGVGEFFGEFVPDWDYPVYGQQVDVDANGNVYVAYVSSFEAGVWRYDAAGNPFPAPGNNGADFVLPGIANANFHDLEVDVFGNVHLAMSGGIVMTFAGTDGSLMKTATFVNTASGLITTPSGEVFATTVSSPPVNDVRINAIVQVDYESDQHVVLVSESGDFIFRDIEYANGSFYVSVQLTGYQQRAEIWRYDPVVNSETGETEYAKIFLVMSEAGVLNDRADFIEIGPDGMLYVMQWQAELTVQPLAEPGILMFDSETGDYVQTVISADDGEFDSHNSSFAFDQRGNLVIVSNERFVFNEETGELHRSRIVRAQGPMGTTATARESGNPDTVLTVSPPEPLSEVSVNDVTLEEGNKGETPFTFIVTRTGPLDGITEVYIETSAGTAFPWTVGGDYTSKNRLFEFLPGDTEFVFTVDVHGDSEDEPNETFFVNLIVLSGGTVADGQGVGTIINDDGGKGGKGGGKPKKSSSTILETSSSSTDTGTSDSTSTDSAIIQSTDPTLLLIDPVSTGEEPDDETLTEDDPAAIIPEDQADLDSLFGDLDGNLQEELLTV